MCSVLGPGHQAACSSGLSSWGCPLCCRSAPQTPPSTTGCWAAARSGRHVPRTTRAPPVETQRHPGGHGGVPAAAAAPAPLPGDQVPFAGVPEVLRPGPRASQSRWAPGWGDVEVGAVSRDAGLARMLASRRDTGLTSVFGPRWSGRRAEAPRLQRTPLSLEAAAFCCPGFRGLPAA